MDALSLRRRAIIGSRPMMDVVWNQIVQNGNFVGTSNWEGKWSITLTAANNILACTCESSGDNRAQQSPSFIAGHTYCFYMQAMGANYGNNFLYIYASSSSTVTHATCSHPGEWETVTKLFTAGGGDVSSLRLNSTGIGTDYFQKVMTFDFTAMFGAGNEPTTVAQFEAWLAENGIDINEYQAYDAGTTKRMTKPSWVV